MLKLPDNLIVQDWFDFMDTHLPKQVTKEQWEQECGSFYRSVCEMEEDAAKILQYLMENDAYDYVGPTELRIAGKTWEHAREYRRPEPPGDDIPEMDVELAQVVVTDKAVRYRPKRDGVLFIGNGMVMTGSFSVAAPYLKAEFTGSVFYVLEGHLKGPEVHSGWTFLPSYYTPDPVASDEGMIVLYQGREYKWKFFPTIEVQVTHGLYNGVAVEGSRGRSVVAEVYWSGSRIIWVRERYHKKPRTKKDWLLKSSLYFYSDILRTLPKISEFVHVTVDQTVIILPVPYDETAQQFLQRPEWQRVALKNYLPTRVGAKGTFRLPEGVAVMKEDHKKWDLVGGTVEMGETPVQAFEREMLEELGEKILYRLEKVIPRIENRLYIETHLFSLNPTVDQLKYFRSSHEVPCVPWVATFESTTRDWPPIAIVTRATPIRKNSSEVSFIPRWRVTEKMLADFSRLVTSYPQLVKKRIMHTPEKPDNFYLTTNKAKKNRGWTSYLNEYATVDLLCVWIIKNGRHLDDPLPFELGRKAFDSWRKEKSLNCETCANVVAFGQRFCFACLGKQPGTNLNFM